MQAIMSHASFFEIYVYIKKTEKKSVNEIFSQTLLIEVQFHLHHSSLQIGN